MRTGRAIALLTIGALGVAACSADPVVTSQRADEIRVAPPPVTVPGGVPSTTADPGAGTSSAPSIPPSPDPDTPAPTVPDPAIDNGAVDPDIIDFGPNKTPHDYDTFLLAVMTDLDAWWSQEFPRIYGQDFRSLQGGIYASYPDRPDDLPGCGEPRTTYHEVQEYVAFYCAQGDFMVYDDGDTGMLADLADSYGAGTIGTVLAHEYGHAIQQRSGAIARGLDTILTEQQADCFAGAWTGRVANGESPIVRYGDSDVRAGLIAMTKVSDPVGVNQYVPGGHGSAFDRVGAFQVGYLEGPQRCSELLDDPLPLVPNEFVTAQEQQSGGNAPFGYGDGQVGGFITADLNAYWAEQLASSIPDMEPLTLVPVQSPDGVHCDGDLQGDFDEGAALCASDGTVYLDETTAEDLYQRFGDFSVGYLLGGAWSEAVQNAVGTDLTGEPRALMDDCLTGAWVKTVIPVDYRLPEPRLASREVSVSAGDLDEAIQTLVVVADPGRDDNVLGDAFEKIDSFRTGVLGGLDACLPDL